MSDIQTLKKRVRSIEHKLADKQAERKAAEQTVERCRNRLEELGFDLKEPIQPQIDELRGDIEAVLANAEQELAELEKEMIAV